MPASDFKPWAAATGANVTPQATYASGSANPALALGVGPGLADSALFNKSMRQGTFWAAALSQYIVNTLGIDVFDDGNLDNAVALLKAAIQAVGPVTWDAGTPPTFDYLLLPGATAVISFSNLASIPLSIATAPNAVYRIIFIVWSTNTTNNDIALLPNNAGYTGAFSNYAIELSDEYLTGFGTATSQPTYAAILTANLASFPGGLGGIPFGGLAPIGVTNFFSYDLFAGPIHSPNDVGPFMLELMASTITAAKFVKGNSVVKGGPALQGTFWNDTTTPWTSLGTLQTPFATQNTGVVRVERIS